MISIHAPLAGSDVGSLRPCARPSNFNPRSPCGERHKIKVGAMTAGGFQSTLPLRGATVSNVLLMASLSFQSTLLLGGATNHPILRSLPFSDFNPRSPCGERLCKAGGKGICAQFQSTLPLRGATPGKMTYKVVRDISIHAPLAGSDK